jgi:hypothetical protein
MHFKRYILKLTAQGVKLKALSKITAFDYDDQVAIKYKIIFIALFGVLSVFDFM